MDQLLDRVIKLEEVVTKLAAWVHFSEPLNLGPGLIRDPPSLPAPVVASNPTSASSTQPISEPSRPSPEATTSTSKNVNVRPKRRRTKPSKFNEYDTDHPEQYSQYPTENDHNHNDQVEGHEDEGETVEFYPNPQYEDVEIKMELDVEGGPYPFDAMPDSLEDEEHDSNFSFGYVPDKNNTKDEEATDPLRDVSTPNTSQEEEEEDATTPTPGLLVFPSTYGKSLRKNNYVAYRGFFYLFHFENRAKDRQVFRCHQLNRHNCKGRIHLNYNLTTVVFNQDSEFRHSHPPEQDFVDAKYHLWRIGRLAITRNDKSPAQTIAEELEKVPDSYKKRLPQPSSILRSVQRQISRDSNGNSRRRSTGITTPKKVRNHVESSNEVG